MDQSIHLFSKVCHPIVTTEYGVDCIQKYLICVCINKLRLSLLSNPGTLRYVMSDWGWLCLPGRGRRAECLCPVRDRVGSL